MPYSVHRRLTPGWVSLVLVILAAGAWAADTPGELEFRFKPARDAVANYGVATERIDREYRERVIAARRSCAAALSSAKEQASRTGNLDEAVRIRDAVASLQAESAAEAADAGPRPATLVARDRLTRRLAGTVWLGSAGRPNRFSADGTVTADDRPKDRGTWAALDARLVVVRWPDGWVNTFEFDENLQAFTPTEFGTGSRKAAGKRLDGGK